MALLVLAHRIATAFLGGVARDFTGSPVEVTRTSPPRPVALAGWRRTVLSHMGRGCQSREQRDVNAGGGEGGVRGLDRGANGSNGIGNGSGTATATPHAEHACLHACDVRPCALPDILPGCRDVETQGKTIINPCLAMAKLERGARTVHPTPRGQASAPCREDKTQWVVPSRPFLQAATTPRNTLTGTGCDHSTSTPNVQRPASSVHSTLLTNPSPRRTCLTGGVPIVIFMGYATRSHPV